MGRRATSLRIADDMAFPVRVKVKAPSDHFGRELSRILSWLDSKMGPGGFGYHTGGALGCDALGFYFRSLEDARRFLAAFPELELAGRRTTPARAISPRESGQRPPGT